MMNKDSWFFRIGMPLLIVLGYGGICITIGMLVNPFAGAGMALAGILAGSLFFFWPRHG